LRDKSRTIILLKKIFGGHRSPDRFAAAMKAAVRLLVAAFLHRGNEAASVMRPFPIFRAFPVNYFLFRLHALNEKKILRKN
jgi:hypothetical protein